MDFKLSIKQLNQEGYLLLNLLKFTVKALKN